MTETIIIALITLASGVFGSGIGAFVTLRTSAKESKRQLREEKKTCYAHFVSAYHAFMAQAVTNDLIQTESDPAKERQLWLQFQTAYANAILICDQTSLDSFGKFFQQTGSLGEGRNASGVNAAYTAAVSAMRKELGTSSIHKEGKKDHYGRK